MNFLLFVLPYIFSCIILVKADTQIKNWQSAVGVLEWAVSGAEIVINRHLTNWWAPSTRFIFFDILEVKCILMWTASINPPPLFTAYMIWDHMKQFFLDIYVNYHSFSIRLRLAILLVFWHNIKRTCRYLIHFWITYWIL